MERINDKEQRQIAGGKYKALVPCVGYAAGECHKDYWSSDYNFCYGSGTIEYWTAADYVVNWYGCWYGPSTKCYAHDADIEAGRAIWGW